MQMTQVKLSSGRALRFRRDETAPAPEAFDRDGVVIDCPALGLFFFPEGLPDGQPWGTVKKYHQFPILVSERSESIRIAPDGWDLRKRGADGWIYLPEERKPSEFEARLICARALERFCPWFWDRVLRVSLCELDGVKEPKEVDSVRNLYSANDFFNSALFDRLTRSEQFEILDRRREIEAAFLLAGGRLH